MDDGCCIDGKNNTENVSLYKHPMNENNRCIQIAWFRQNLPDMPFNQFMTFPCELSLKTTKDGIRLFTNPVKEIKNLYKANHKYERLRITPNNFNKKAEAEINFKYESGIYDVEAVIDTGAAEEVLICIRGIDVVYKVREQILSCSGIYAPLKENNQKISLRMLVDTASVEIFGNEGEVYMPVGVIFDKDNLSISLSTKGGEAIADSLDVYELESIWK